MSEGTNSSTSNVFVGSPEQVTADTAQEASNNVEMDSNPQENQSSGQNTDQNAAQSVGSTETNNNRGLRQINEQNTGQNAGVSRSDAFAQRLRCIEPVNGPRPENNQIRIQQRKKHLRELSREKKITHLANASACHHEKCNCTGWKSGDAQHPNIEANSRDSFGDLCGTCKHTLTQHVFKLLYQSDELLNTLLGVVIDIDSVFSKKSQEIDPDLIQIYNFILKHFRKAILDVEKPLGFFTDDGPLGQPPFEKPVISKAIANFLIYKFKHLALEQWNLMCDMSKLFLQCLNQWKWETMHSKKKSINALEALTYKINYTRYFVFCNVSAYCDSLGPHWEVIHAFGKTALRLIFNSFCKTLVYNFFNGNKKGMPIDKRLFFTK